MGCVEGRVESGGALHSNQSLKLHLVPRGSCASWRLGGVVLVERSSTIPTSHRLSNGVVASCYFPEEFVCNALKVSRWNYIIFITLMKTVWSVSVCSTGIHDVDGLLFLRKLTSSKKPAKLRSMPMLHNDLVKVLLVRFVQHARLINLPDQGLFQVPSWRSCPHLKPAPVRIWSQRPTHVWLGNTRGCVAWRCVR